METNVIDVFWKHHEKKVVKKLKGRRYDTYEEKKQRHLGRLIT